MFKELDYYICMTRKEYVPALTVAFVTLCAYFLTVLPATRGYASSYFLFYIFIAGVGIVYWPFARKTLKDERLMTLYFGAVFVSLLLWIGVTGWFFSPFFYFLYLLAIILAFVYSPLSTLAFVLVLLGLFTPNIGSIDLTLDIITIVSLLSVVPLTHFLQKEYLQMKQTEKKVLILEEKGKELKNKVDEVLANKVSSFAVKLRQPVNDMRQVALVALKGGNAEKVKTALHKIAVLGRESLDQIEHFEEGVTGKELLHTKKKGK